MFTWNPVTKSFPFHFILRFRSQLDFDQHQDAFSEEKCQKKYAQDASWQTNVSSWQRTQRISGKQSENLSFRTNPICRIFRNASMSFRLVSDAKSRSDLEMASRRAAVTTSRTWRGNSDTRWSSRTQSASEQPGMGCCLLNTGLWLVQ